MVSGESDHFYSRTALMYIYMGHMRYEHTKLLRGPLLGEERDRSRGWVERWTRPIGELELSDGRWIAWDVPAGSQRQPQQPLRLAGTGPARVQGLYGLQDLERMERDTTGVRQAVVVGGGLIGVELAEMLHSRGIHVTFLVREPALGQEYYRRRVPTSSNGICGSTASTCASGPDFRSWWTTAQAG